MYSLANMLYTLEGDSCATWFERARAVGEAHGFFTLESKACLGLGQLAMLHKRKDEAVQLLQNSLKAAELNELDDPEYELFSMKSLIRALFDTDAIDEVEPLVRRFAAAAKTFSKDRTMSVMVFDSFACSARLHEVIFHPLTSCAHPPPTSQLHFSFFEYLLNRGLSLQARGNPREAVREVRAMLDLMRVNKDAVQNMSTGCVAVLMDAVRHLKVLNPVHNYVDKDLVYDMEIAVQHLSTKHQLELWT